MLSPPPSYLRAREPPQSPTFSSDPRTFHLKAWGLISLELAISSHSWYR